MNTFSIDLSAIERDLIAGRRAFSQPTIVEDKDSTGRRAFPTTDPSLSSVINGDWIYDVGTGLNSNLGLGSF